MWSAGMIVALVMVEFLEVCLNTLSKAAMKRGMSNYVFILYSYTSATIFLFLSTLTFHRITSPPPSLTLLVIFKIFLLGLVGFSLQFFMFNGIGYASPTLASAMINLTPVWTFIFAILFRMENLDLKMKSSQAKSIGSIISITGAFIVTLYKGPSIILSSSSLSNSLHQLLLSPSPSWIIGGFVLAVASFLKALMYIVQAIYGITLRNVIHMWALKKKGPVFVTMFKPLGIVIAVFLGVSFLADSLYLGSVIGAVIIAVGFYAVMWGKAKEEKTVEDRKIIIVVESSSANVPFLENR